MVQTFFYLHQVFNVNFHLEFQRIIQVTLFTFLLFFAYSLPFCARRALARRLHFIFSHRPHWILSISTCSVHRALQVDPKTWWREAFFFFSSLIKIIIKFFKFQICNKWFINGSWFLISNVKFYNSAKNLDKFN